MSFFKLLKLQTCRPKNRSLLKFKYEEGDLLSQTERDVELNEARFNEALLTCNLKLLELQAKEGLTPVLT